MYRVTGNSMKDDLVYNMQNNMQTMERMHNNLSTGKKVRVPHENVVAATHSMLYRTRIEQISQYITNIDEGSERLTMTESSMRGINDMLQRFQELAVQAGNGIYTDQDRAKIAVEVDELIQQMVQTANSKFKGESLFSGHKTDSDPFFILRGTSSAENADREVITEVLYRGNIGKQLREIEQSEYIPVNLAGNEVFWTNNQVLISSVNIDNFGNSGQAYTAPADSMIRIDGKEISIAAGDDIDTILTKINSSHIQAFASRSGFNDEFIEITSTTPHELWIEDLGAGTVMRDLGFADPNMEPNAVPSGTTRTTVSLFDMAIKFRDDLWNGNVEQIGGRDIALIQSAQDNLLKHTAEVGARMNRMETVKYRLTQDHTSMMDILAKTENIDFPETIMNLKMMEYIHQSSLASGAKIMMPTLIDFLR